MMEQRRYPTLHLGLGLGLVKFRRHGPPMRVWGKFAGQQGGEDKSRPSFTNQSHVPK